MHVYRFQQNFSRSFLACRSFTAIVRTIQTGKAQNSKLRVTKLRPFIFLVFRISHASTKRYSLNSWHTCVISMFMLLIRAWSFGKMFKVSVSLKRQFVDLWKLNLSVLKNEKVRLKQKLRWANCFKMKTIILFYRPGDGQDVKISAC